ncbi:glycoside hydrolase family 76 protein [Terracidiphilus gabretensis]|uniref:glycoside hydrolase family 76 protein n=1 Tax=Terracidiphilus gabretensis TaxID=1577687 RepID=UPI00071B7DA8|nr:glycoside hydrolase family 76 protein [Terracidiphilus gabretensis]
MPSVQKLKWIFYCVLFATSFRSADTQGAAAANETVSYHQRAALGIKRLQAWYDPATGLYKTTGWWNSANAITTLADYTQVTGDKQYADVFPTTLSAAQHKSAGFLNDYYDDEGWWALAWIDVYDITRDPRYLHMSASIFEDMAKGWDTNCSGGIWWSKERKYKNAISNELFLSVAAHLLTREKNKKLQAHYLDWANREWEWFSHTGMINSDHLINDGLDAQCANNHRTTWSYNQGVILGGLSELYTRTHDSSLLAQASSIVAATLTSPILVDAHGILHDPCEPNCGGDGTQFKGIFARNLALLYHVSPSPRYKTFLLTNAESIWAGMKPPDYGIGVTWTAPYGTIDASTQSSGDDALIAAASVSGITK